MAKKIEKWLDDKRRTFRDGMKLLSEYSTDRRQYAIMVTYRDTPSNMSSLMFLLKGLNKIPEKDLLKARKLQLDTCGYEHAIRNLKKGLEIDDLGMAKKAYQIIKSSPVSKKADVEEFGSILTAIEQAIDYECSILSINQGIETNDFEMAQKAFKFIESSVVSNPEDVKKFGGILTAIEQKFEKRLLDFTPDLHLPELREIYDYFNLHSNDKKKASIIYSLTIAKKQLTEKNNSDKTQ